MSNEVQGKIGFGQTMVGYVCLELFGVAALLPLSVAVAAEAGTTQQRSQFNFAMAAKPLPQALSDFSRITGISVVYTDEAPYGITAPAVTGR